jgi:hypothetical protein
VDATTVTTAKHYVGAMISLDACRRSAWYQAIEVTAADASVEIARRTAITIMIEILDKLVDSEAG